MDGNEMSVWFQVKSNEGDDDEMRGLVMKGERIYSF
jgi:hypothetical protein